MTTLLHVMYQVTTLLLLLGSIPITNTCVEILKIPQTPPAPSTSGHTPSPYSNLRGEGRHPPPNYFNWPQSQHFDNILVFDQHSLPACSGLECWFLLQGGEGGGVPSKNLISNLVEFSGKLCIYTLFRKRRTFFLQHTYICTY